MAKRYDEAIDVTPDREGGPVAFLWRGRRYEVDQHLTVWREAGEWWNNGHGKVRDREYYRVLARPAGLLSTGDLDSDGFLQSSSAVYDLYWDRAGDCWRMARLWD